MKIIIRNGIEFFPMTGRWSLATGIIFILILQILSFSVNPYTSDLSKKSTQFDFQNNDHHSHSHSPVSITLESYGDEGFKLELLSIFDAEIDLQIESSMPYFTDLHHEDKFQISANSPKQFFKESFFVFIVFVAPNCLARFNL